MIIKNLTQNKILAQDAKLATGLIDKTFGLLLKSNPRALIFFTRFGLHTFGLSDPIDILVLDDRGLVVKIGRDIPPNRLFVYNPLHRIVIELPSGTISHSRTRLNDKITFA